MGREGVSQWGKDAIKADLLRRFDHAAQHKGRNLGIGGTAQGVGRLHGFQAFASDLQPGDFTLSRPKLDRLTVVVCMARWRTQ